MIQNININKQTICLIEDIVCSYFLQKYPFILHILQNQTIFIFNWDNVMILEDFYFELI